MSDFLARVAARAVGQVAGARPRLPARYEPLAPGAAGIEIVETAIAAGELTTTLAPRVAPAGPRGTTSFEPTGQRIRSGARPRSRPALAPEASEATAGDPRVPSEQVTAVLALVPERNGDAGPVERVKAAPRTLPEVSDTPPEPARAVAEARARPAAAVPLVPAMPANAEGPAQVQAPQPRRQPPAVRIHIGRLEVRANVQQAPPPSPRTSRPGPRPRELSLGDYLRGRRMGL